MADETETFLFTSESVNEGHPDKLADQVGSITAWGEGDKRSDENSTYCSTAVFRLPMTDCSCNSSLAICRYQMLSWTHAWRRTPTQRWALILPIFAAQKAACLPALGAGFVAPCTSYLHPWKSASHTLQSPSGLVSCPFEAQVSCLQVACETATKTNMVMVFGEITTSAKVDYEKVVRDTCREIGFISDDVGLDADKCKVSRPTFRILADASLCRRRPCSRSHPPALGVC